MKRPKRSPRTLYKPASSAIKQLRRTWMNRWWLINLGLWLTVFPLSVWSLRRTWEQLVAFFTWSALRYGLIFNRPAAIGLGLCIGLTTALLFKESRYHLWGLTRRERYNLLKSLRQRRRGK
jgi:hypothetical protein